jgi:hypothetical protein
MKITVLSNAKQLKQRMAEFRNVVGKDIRESLKAHARVACVYLASRTQPYGDGDKPKAQGEGAVSKDIDKVYYTQGSERLYNQVSNIAIRWYSVRERDANARDASKGRDPNWGQNERSRQRGDKVASFQSRFKSYQASGNTQAIKRIVKDMKFKGISEDGFDKSYHKNARDPVTGRVKGKDHRVLVLGAEGQLEDYRKQVMDRVGLTKAGWAVCAEAIPISGRVSVNTRGIPQWVTRHIGRASGRIVDSSSHPTAPGVQMTNATPWADRVIPPKEAQKALDAAGKSYLAYMDIAISEHLKKTYELASAA